MNSYSIGLCKALALGLSLAMLLALGACGDRADDRTAGQKLDSAIAKTGQVAGEVKQDTKEAAAATGAALKDASAKAGVAVREAGAETKTSVMAAAADTRAAAARAGDNVGAKVDDAQITAGVNAGFAADNGLSAAKIDVDTKDGVVTLKGPVPSTAAKTRAAEIAKNVKDVKSVKNQLSVKAG